MTDQKIMLIEESFNLLYTTGLNRETFEKEQKVSSTSEEVCLFFLGSLQQAMIFPEECEDVY